MVVLWQAPSVAEMVAVEGNAKQLVKKFVVEGDSSSDEVTISIHELSQ